MLTPKLTAALLTILGSAAASEDIRIINMSDVPWHPTPEGVAFANLQGDRFAEAYQALVELPAGTVSPPHIKSANMFGVMIQGQMVHHPVGMDPSAAPRVVEGGFYHIPAGLAHVSACVSERPCITYLYQDGPFDFNVQ